jgi:hypothetical protein
VSKHRFCEIKKKFAGNCDSIVCDFDFISYILWNKK